MSSKRLFYILLGAIGVLLIALLGGVYVINNLLAGKANNLTSLKAKSAALSEEQQTLSKAKQDIKKYTGLQKITQSIVPEDKNQAEAVREIVKIAATNNVSLAAINFPASTLGNAPTTPASASPAPATTTSAGSSSSKPSSRGGLSQLLPVKNIPGVYQLVITVQGDPNQPVRYDKFVNFLSDLERNRRTAQVSTITIEPDITNRNFLSFTLTLNEYIKP